MRNLRSRSHRRKRFLRNLYKEYTERAGLALVRYMIPALLYVFAAPIAAYCAVGAGMPPVSNYSRTDYNAGTQNWNIETDDLGRLYFANSYGLLRYDGTSWRLFPLPNRTSVRALYIDRSKERIYVGGTDEFGYYAPSGKSGELKYTSLINTMPAKDRHFNEAWNIFKHEGNLWVQTDMSLLRYDGKSTVCFNLGEKIDCAGVVNGDIIVGVSSGKLLKIGGFQSMPLAGADALVGKRLVEVLPYDSKRMLIVTSVDGLFLYDSEGVHRFDTDIDSFMRENQVFCAARMSSGKDRVFAFGTVNNGVVMKNFSDGRVRIANRTSGLNNNTVLSLKFDITGNLWLGLDNGIGYARMSAPDGNLFGPMNSCGAGYASMIMDNMVYLGTNQGLYSMPESELSSRVAPSPQRILSGQVWSIDNVGGDMMVSGDAGLFVRKGAVLRRIGLIPGAWHCVALKSKPGYALVSAYDGFHLLHKGLGGEWTDAGRVSGYDENGGKFIEDNAGDIWIAHWMKGVYHLRLSADGRRISTIATYNKANGLPSDKNNSVLLLNGKVVIASENGYFDVTGNGRLAADKMLNGMFPKKVPMHIHRLPSGGIVCAGVEGIWYGFIDKNGRSHTDSTTFNYLRRFLIPGFDSFTPVGNGNVLMSHQEGFSLVNFSSVSSANSGFEPFVAALYGKSDSLLMSQSSPLKGKGMGKLQLPYGENTLRFEIAVPEYRYPEAMEIYCKLDGYEKEWTLLANSRIKEYTQLREGNYTFRLKSRNAFTGQEWESEMPFTVLPPWYRNTIAKLLYSLLILCAFWGAAVIIRKSSRRAAADVSRRKEEELQKLREEAKKDALLKDYEISELKSRELEADIEHKTRELSSVTMNVVQKNEILQKISDKIVQLQTRTEKDTSSSSAIYRQELSKLHRLIQRNLDPEDDWAKVNVSFELVHRDFTTRLSERHPSLNAADRRICCYLRMGLSSKEIAPLLNISPRSVEMTRYRLRKKLELDREVNLTEYMQEF